MNPESLERHRECSYCGEVYDQRYFHDCDDELGGCRGIMVAALITLLILFLIVVGPIGVRAF